MLNAPLPPDIDVTDRLQMVISEWKGAQEGRQLARLYQDCVDAVGQDKQLLPLKIVPVRELDSTSLEKALRQYRFTLDYGIDTVGRFESALVPVLRESGAAGFLFAYDEELSVKDQVALFAHAVGHLLINHQQRLADRNLDLDPDEGQTHTDRLAELRYLDISGNRNYLDRKVLESFPKLTKLIELPEESQAEQGLAMQDLAPMLRRQGWVNQYVKTPYRYTQGRVIPNSTQRGKRISIDALLRVEASLPAGVVHVQRPTESPEEAIRRVRNAALQLRLPFAYVYTRQKDFIELNWLSGSLSDPRVHAILPTRQELQTRWLSALQLSDQRAKDALAYPYQPDIQPRYYQEAAINQAVIATLLARRGLRDRRILLTLATGTGKTQIAFQILWKLKKTFQMRNVLFLADRGYLLDQAQTNTFGPFRDAITRGMGVGDTAHDILFGTYQWLTNMQDGVERYMTYPADYFDIIVIDECHRGSADDNSNWRRVLEHFSPAVQIGLTATPLNTEDVKTQKYFGPSVYTYSLSQGINDGYLAPYSVRRIQIGSQQATEMPTGAPKQTLDQQIVMQTGRTMRQYTQTIADHLAQYLRERHEPRAQKTIVFCVDNDHADKMRIALEEACADWSRPGDIVRIVDDDKAEGKRALNLFCTIRERQPVIVTTARLLTTGIDAPTCKNIVLARGVGSIVEFKQIIGRGTRISEPDKISFTILDYAGAIKHFFDPAFDGDPTSIQVESLIPATITPATDDEAQKPTTPNNDLQERTMTEQDTGPNASSETIATPEIATNEAGSKGGADYQPTQEPNLLITSGEAYQSTQQDATGAAEITNDIPTGDSATLETEASTIEAANDATEQEHTLPLIEATQSIATTTAAPIASDKAIKSTIPSPKKNARQTKQTKEQLTPTEPPPVIIPKENGYRFVIIGEYFYELDASGVTLHEGTCSDFTRRALKDMISTPDDLRKYWSDKSIRELLLDQLAKEVVALDALAQALNVPTDIDYFDLLLYVLFQQSMITRTERVQRLRVQHSTFFQRFENNRSAKELLDVILDKYSHGNSRNLNDMRDVNDLGWLSVQPLNERTTREWSQAFNQGPTKTTLSAVLKELQELLYSI